MKGNAKTMGIVIGFCAIVCAALIALTMTGFFRTLFGNQPSSVPTAATQKSSTSGGSATSSHETLEIGTGDASTTFSNKTGMEIVGVAMKSSEDDTFGANLLSSNQKVADGSTFIVHYIDTGSQTVSTAGSLVIELKALYDVQLTFSDGTSAVMWQLSLPDLSEADIHYSMSDAVAYIEYTDGVTGEKVSTEFNAVGIAEHSASQASVASMSGAVSIGSSQVG